MGESRADRKAREAAESEAEDKKDAAAAKAFAQTENGKALTNLMHHGSTRPLPPRKDAPDS